MRALGIAFSGRKNGNCDRSLAYCLDHIADGKNSAAIVYMREHPVQPCGECEYTCFSGAMCPVKDDMDDIVAQCIQADIVLWALPTYRGHLPSAYFAFSERLEGYVQRGIDVETGILKKVHIILIGNLSAGADIALYEILSEFADKPFCPETVLLSSRDYHRRSIDGDMLEEEPVRQRLDRFTHDILLRIKS